MVFHWLLQITLAYGHDDTCTDSFKCTAAWPEQSTGAVAMLLDVVVAHATALN